MWALSRKLKLELIFILFLPSVFCEITTFINFPSRNAGLPGQKSVFYVHDWNTGDLGKSKEIKSVLLEERKDVRNVLLCDWSTFSQTPDYYNVAKKFTSRVAQDIVKEIQSLLRDDKRDPGDIELVGHGLGAHICGQVGKLWNKERSGNQKPIGKIIGTIKYNLWYMEMYKYLCQGLDLTTMV